VALCCVDCRWGGKKGRVRVTESSSSTTSERSRTSPGFMHQGSGSSASEVVEPAKSLKIVISLMGSGGVTKSRRQPRYSRGMRRITGGTRFLMSYLFI